MAQSKRAFGVFSDSPSVLSSQVRTLSEGDFFGETALMEDEFRSATVQVSDG